MPIFDDVIAPEAVWPESAAWPLRRAEALLRRFRAKFPGIHFDLYWPTRLMNAQAYIGGAGRCVRIYGGLVRHRRVGVEGVAYALAHETGHHLGGPPRHPVYSTLASEQSAHDWAEREGLPTLFGPAKAQRYLQRGRAQLAAVWNKYRS